MMRNRERNEKEPDKANETSQEMKEKESACGDEDDMAEQEGRSGR